MGVITFTHKEADCQKCSLRAVTNVTERHGFYVKHIIICSPTLSHDPACQARFAPNYRNNTKNAYDGHE